MPYYHHASGGFFDALASAPAGAVEIAEAARADLLAGQASGRSIVLDRAGRPTLAPEDPVVRRADALVRIDVAAGAARARYLTVAPGQELTYQAKAEECRAYAAAVDPHPTDYPMLLAEALACGMTLPETAAAATEALALWTQVGAQIEAQRMAGKRAVMAAATLSTIEAARDAAITALQAL